MTNRDLGFAPDSLAESEKLNSLPKMNLLCFGSSNGSVLPNDLGRFSNSFEYEIERQIESAVF